MPAARRGPDERPLEMPQGRRIPRPSERRQPAKRVRVERTEGPIAKAGAELAALASTVRACTACARAADARAFGTGFPRARLFLIKGSPADVDLATGNAFAGESDALTKALDALGIPLSWVYGTVAVRCGADDPSADELDACAPHLLVELEAVAPRVVVAFGEGAVTALRALDGRCGIAVPEDVQQGEPVALRTGLVLVVTEPLPEGVRVQRAKRRLWKDLQQLPRLL